MYFIIDYNCCHYVNAMKRGYVIRKQGQAHFLTITVVEGIDTFKKSYED